MSGIDTFAAIANSQEPDGRYYPFQPREQVPYAGNFTRYGFNPEPLHFQSIAPPPPAAGPAGTDSWNLPLSYWGGAQDKENEGGGDDTGPSDEGPSGSNPGTGPLGSVDAPTLSTMTNVAEAFTSPLGKLLSAPVPFSSIAQLAAHGVLSAANQAKTAHVFEKENIAKNERGGASISGGGDNSGDTGNGEGDAAGVSPSVSGTDPDANDDSGMSSPGDSGGGGGDSGAGGPSGGPACCFIAETPILMENGTDKPISDIRIGDKVRDPFGNVNTVLAVKKTVLGSRALASYNEVTPYMSSDHPVLTTDGWKAARPIEENFNFHVAPAAVGDILITRNGPQDIEAMNISIEDPELPLYDLTLDGTHIYFANGVAVHNCWHGGLVGKEDVTGADPSGPDTGYVKIQAGEYVLPRYVVEAFGVDALDMLRKAVAPSPEAMGMGPLPKPY